MMSVLLKDRTTGNNLIWATDDYAPRGDGFSFHDEILLEQIVSRDDPVIRPRVDKSQQEQKSRIVKNAEVFTPAWICNKQNNLVDAAWFGWTKPDSSPFNEECKASSLPRPWKRSSDPIQFPVGRTWRDYVKACRLEVSCGEAPYLTSRYDASTGHMIPVADRIGLLDRKLRVITENLGTSDPQEWFYYAKRAVQSCYGFDWQGDNVLLARENVLAAVVEAFNADFHGAESSYPGWSRKPILELAEVVSWNIWQMDGIKFVVPKSCERVEEKDIFGNVAVKRCPGCTRKDSRRHVGRYCMVMDWSSDLDPRPIRFVDMMGGA
ncbi:MAG: restriction endonuclease subunit M [Kiritimatiellae bacterium]|nr:restriction endonuclease subunit M [Kiritimatiellia bacterium]